MKEPRLPLLIVLVFATAYYQLVGADDDPCSRKSTNKVTAIRLKQDLLCDYDTKIRPTQNHRNATTVSVMMLLKFFSYGEHSETLNVHNWLYVTWKDEHLKWVPSEYDSIKQIHLSSNDIWTPDLSVFNGNNLGGDQRALSTVDCEVINLGYLSCVHPVQNTALCRADLSQYPFDTQNCTLSYGSWVHSGEEIDLNFMGEAVSLESYDPNADWELLSVNATKNPGIFECCPNNTYPTLNYNFVIKRQSGSLAATVIIPALVMVIITLTTLWMNPQEIDRMFLSCCNLILHITYLEFISWKLPIQGKNPALIILFGRDSLLICTFTIVLTVFLKHLTKKSSKGSTWISSLINTIVGNRPGQLFLLYDVSLEGINPSNFEEDRVRMVEENIESAPEKRQLDKCDNKDYILFGKLIDRLTFIAFVITYFITFLKFVP